PTYQGDIHSVGGTRVRSKTSDSCDHLSTRIRCGESLLPVGRVVLEHHTAGADERVRRGGLGLRGGYCYHCRQRGLVLDGRREQLHSQVLNLSLQELAPGLRVNIGTIRPNQHLESVLRGKNSLTRQRNNPGLKVRGANRNLVLDRTLNIPHGDQPTKIGEERAGRLHGPGIHVRLVIDLLGGSRHLTSCVIGPTSVGSQNTLQRDGPTTETVRELRGLDRGSNILDRRAHRDTPTQRMTSSSVKTSLVALSAMAS